jgi:phospholipid/cholesterol/gamma-HCH transport system substrate-binding protein
VNRSTMEIVVGGLILAVVALFFVASYSGVQLAHATGYAVLAGFNRVDGLADGNEVRLSGVRVGYVESQQLDPYFRAVLTMRIEPGIELPVDSSAAIHTDGLFGSKFVVIDPGGDLAILEDGDEIQYTQDAVIVEDLLDLIISEGKARLATASQPQGEGAKP